MKYIAYITFFLSICYNVVAQTKPSSFPVPYAPTAYYRIGWIKADSALISSLRDTNFLPRFSGTITFRPQNVRPYYYDSTALRWFKLFSEPDTLTTLATRYDLTQLPQTTLSNIGSGLRWVATSDGQIKTVSPSNTILWDSTSTANTLTAKADTSVLATQYDLLSAQNIQQVLTVGDTSLRQLIWKDTASATGTNGFVTSYVVPSNNGTVYTNGVGGKFSTSIAKFSGVNPDGRPNVVGNFWGYNVDPGGGRINTNEASYRFAGETHYQLDVAQNPAFEFHLPEITTQTGSIYRPLSLYVRKNSGYTNFNMQVHSINYLTQESGAQWGSYSYDSNVTINYTAGANSKRISLNAQLPSFIGTMLYDSTGWSISSSVTNSTKQFGTNLPIRYGASSNRSGMDGYGDVTFREGKNTIFNTGTNTVFADWQFNSSQKFNFTKDNAVFNVSLLTVGSANIVPVGGSKIISANGEALLISSSGGAGSDIRFLNGVDNSRQMTIFIAPSGSGNVNIGTSTIDPAHKLRVQGSAVVDSNLYVKMHTIASNSDSAVIWDRATNEYKVARINGTSNTFNNGLTNTAGTVQLGGALVQATTISSATAANNITISGVNTSGESAMLRVTTTGASGFAIQGESSTGRGVYGTSGSSGTGVYGNNTSTGTGVFGNNSSSGYGGQFSSSSGVGLYSISSGSHAAELFTNRSSTNTTVPILKLYRLSQSAAGNGVAGTIEFNINTDQGAGFSVLANEIVSKLTTVTAGSETSQLSFTGRNGGVAGTILTLGGDGSMTTVGRRFMAVVTSSAGTLTIGNSEAYVFNGTTTTWTLPAVSGTTGLIYILKNIGSGSITLNAAAAANEIYSTSAVNTYEITAGSSITLVSNGVYFTVN